MKKKIFYFIFQAAIPVMVMAQVKTAAPVINPKPQVQTAAQVKIVNAAATRATTSSPQLTEGKDLTISIDRVDDVSAFDLNTYNVQYTVTNTGTVDLNMTFPISIKGTFNTIENKYFCAGGSMNLPASSGPQLHSGQKVQGVFVVNAPRLQKDVSYKFSLMIDGDGHLTEANENNNTAETTITAHAIKNADYFLESCKVTIKTGNDNKEANNSLVYFYLGPANYNENSFFSYGDWSKG
ncbi:MAG TPA: CARDB domain-containing protein, partial [Chitinophagaceae bacterium]|nr:CARDB domain-containing protein [Chitinophagaceae bacterium]